MFGNRVPFYLLVKRETKMWNSCGCMNVARRDELRTAITTKSSIAVHYSPLIKSG